jgi:hypothetical protein
MRTYMLNLFEFIIPLCYYYQGVLTIGVFCLNFFSETSIVDYYQRRAPPIRGSSFSTLVLDSRKHHDSPTDLHGSFRVRVRLYERLFQTQYSIESQPSGRRLQREERKELK